MDAEFQCTNCEGFGYFDTPDGGEVACSVCHGKAAYSPQEIARMEAAEAECAKWREMHDDRDQDLQHEYARANAAEVECERLRAQVEEARSLIFDAIPSVRLDNPWMDRANAWMRRESEDPTVPRYSLADLGLDEG